MHFSLIKDEDLIRVDHSGTVVDGGKNRRLNYGKTTTWISPSIAMSSED